MGYNTKPLFKSSSDKWIKTGSLLALRLGLPFRFKLSFLSYGMDGAGNVLLCIFL